MQAAPLLALFGWFFVFPELIGVGLQRILYEPYPKPSKLKTMGFALLSAIVGGVVVALLTPKEQGSESEYWMAGLLAGAVAAAFSFACIHVIKSSEYKSANKIRRWWEARRSAS